MSANYYNIYNLAAEYDSSDWMPLFDSYFDARSYIINLDSIKLKEITLMVKCSGLFCVLILDNFNDNLIYDKTKNRIYIDVIMRNFAFIETDDDAIIKTGVGVNEDAESNYLKKTQKICLIENIFIANNRNVHNNQIGIYLYFFL